MQHRPNPVLAKRLTEAMGQWTPGMLEAATDIPRQQIWQLMQARLFPPTDDELKRIASALGEKPEWLKGESDVR